MNRVMEKEWFLVKTYKDGGKVYRHKILRYIAESLKNGKFLVYRDTYNLRLKYPRELSYEETTNFYNK